MYIDLGKIGDDKLEMVGVRFLDDVRFEANDGPRKHVFQFPVYLVKLRNGAEIALPFQGEKIWFPQLGVDHVKGHIGNLEVESGKFLALMAYTEVPKIQNEFAYRLTSGKGGLFFRVNPKLDVEAGKIRAELKKDGLDFDIEVCPYNRNVAVRINISSIESEFIGVEYASQGTDYLINICARKNEALSSIPIDPAPLLAKAGLSSLPGTITQTALEKIVDGMICDISKGELTHQNPFLYA